MYNYCVLGNPASTAINPSLLLASPVTHLSIKCQPACPAFAEKNKNKSHLNRCAFFILPFLAVKLISPLKWKLLYAIIHCL